MLCFARLSRLALEGKGLQPGRDHADLAGVDGTADYTAAMAARAGAVTVSFRPSAEETRAASNTA